MRPGCRWAPWRKARSRGRQPRPPAVAWPCSWEPPTSSASRSSCPSGSERAPRNSHPLRLKSASPRISKHSIVPWAPRTSPAACASRWSPGPFSNTAWGSSAPRGDFSAHWQRWRIAVGLAAGLLLLHVGAQAWSWWHLNRAEHEVDGLIAELVDPQWTSGSGSIRERVGLALADAQGRSGRSGLLPALQVLAEAMNAVPGSRIQALSFRDGALQLKVRASDAQSLDRINQSLRSACWRAGPVPCA